MITLQINGTEYNNFTEITVRKSMKSLAGTFDFRAVQSSARAISFPIKTGDEAVVLVNDIPFLTGFVEIFQGTINAKQHITQIRGRSKTADIIDSTMGGPKSGFSPQKLSLQKLAELTLSSNGITGIGVSVEVPVDDFLESQIEEAGTGETVFQFLLPFAKQRSVLMTQNGVGDLVFTRGSGQKIPGGVALMLRKRDPKDPERSNSNNVKESKIVYDISKRFHSYQVRSQGNASALNLTGDISEETLTDASNEPVIDNGGPFSLTPIRKSRRMVALADKSSSPAECAQRAKWMADIARVKSFSYEATVVGHTIFGTSVPWDYNFLIQTKDEFADIDNELLINSVELRLSPQNGSTTKLSMVPPDAYTAELEEPIKIEKSGGLGFDLNS